jgi:protein-disulfide isomerase
MEEGKKGLFDLLDRKQAFILGVVGAFLLICTIGFFILLSLVLSGANLGGDGSGFKAPKQFSSCLETHKYASTISAEQQEGEQLGVQGTPALFIDGYFIAGAYPYEAVKTVLDAVLAGKEPQWDTKLYGELKKVSLPSLTDVVWKGDANAKVTLVEYADFECPYCVKFNATMKQVFTNYGDKIRYTYRHFPLSFHANAQGAAEAYECAKEQGKAYEMYDKLFALSGNSQLGLENYKKAAAELKLK